MNANGPSIPLPKDPRHQRFADLVISGISAAQAYGEAGFQGKSAQSLAANASRLLKRADVRLYMDAIRLRAADASTMTLMERRQFYARIVRTPLLAINPDDPDFKNGDLIKKVKRRRFVEGEGDGEKEGYVEEFEKLDPLKACELDTKAAGEDSDSNAMSALADALRTIGTLSSGPLPTGKM